MRTATRSAGSPGQRENNMPGKKRPRRKGASGPKTKKAKVNDEDNDSSIEAPTMVTKAQRKSKAIDDDTQELTREESEKSGSESPAVEDVSPVQKGKKKTVKKIQRKRTETTYCTNLRDAMRNNLPLRANRRGVIFNSDGERPSFAIDELYRNRRIGLSYKQIGKKLGIDPDRENVIHVYKALREEAEEELPSIEDIDAPSKVTPPTPLWYLFDSELEAIAQTALPNPVDIKNVKPQLKLFERLGTHAGYSLSIFMQVGDVLLEELKRSLSCNPGSPVQKLNIWTNKLPIALLTKSWEIQRSVAEAAYMMSSYWAPDQGTCKCGAILTLRFGWKVSPISYPSFFWGCAAFDRRDIGKHDQAKPHRATLWEVISRSLHAMTDKEIEVLREKLTTLGQTWMERNEEQDSPQLVADLQHATDRYGGPKNMIPYKSQSHVAKQLEIMQKKINEHMDSNKEQEKDS